MKSFLDTFDGITIAMSTMFGLSQIETLVGIIVLGLQGLILLSKLIYNIAKKLKDKDYVGALKYAEGIVNDFKQLQEEVNDNE